MHSHRDRAPARPAGTRLGAVVLATFVLAGCRVRLDEDLPSPSGQEAPSPISVEVPSGEQASRPARETVLPGWREMEVWFATVRRGARTVRGVPQLVYLPELERAEIRRYPHGTARGPIRSLAAFGIDGRAPLPPAAMADLILDGEAERRAMAATVFRETSRRRVTPHREQRCYRVEMLRRGFGLIRFDFRFSTCIDRLDLEDGTVLLRYEPAPDAPGEGVTLYRGGCRIEPAPGGCRVTEVVVLGTDFRVPFFLRSIARGSSLGVFQDRAEALWTRARWRAQGKDPLQAERRRAAGRPRSKGSDPNEPH